jgi:RHS repeat-associated protein
VPSGGGQGSLYYPLHDHLGGLADVLDGSGNQVPSAKTTYWPYGATRSGGVTQTDKMYTGQQIENGDSALGLYNYKARFYSTALGRFVSADPTADSLNRYTYVSGNPLRFVDSSGETANIACGTNQHCGSGDIGAFRNAIIQEWIEEGRYPGANMDFLNWIFDSWLVPALQNGFSVEQTIAVFGLAFLDTGGYDDAVKDGAFGWGDVGSFLYNNSLFGRAGADIWIGYSMGGGTVLTALRRQYGNHGVLPHGAILIEPAVRWSEGELPDGLADLVRIIAIRDPDSSWIPLVHKPVYGVYNIIDDACGFPNQHCSHAGRQALLVQLAHVPGGSMYDGIVEQMMNDAGVRFERHSPPGHCRWYLPCIIL